MKAVRLHQFGGLEVLSYEDAPVAAPHSGQVLINTIAAGVNPIDWKTRDGGGASGFLGDFPVILGWECSGRIEVVSSHQGRSQQKNTQEADSQWQTGDLVFGLLNFPEAGNCYAEKVIADANHIARIPDGLDPLMMSGLPLVGLTAWQALFEVANLQSGQKVLVLAAAGGVGHIAVQLAKWAGAWVAGSASSHNQEQLIQLGCDQAIDYQQQQLDELLSDIDVIIDAVGGETAIAALDCLADDGVMVTLPSVSATQVADAATKKNRKALPMRVSPNAVQLEKLAQLMVDGKLKLNLDRVFPLNQVAEAHQHSQNGRPQGKIILKIAD